MGPLDLFILTTFLYIEFVSPVDETDVEGFACLSLKPHDNGKYQPATPGLQPIYTISLAQPVFRDHRAIVAVTLAGKQPFTGFVAQARPLDSPAPLGRWDDIKDDGGLALNCAYDNDTAVALDISPINTVSLTWSTTNANLGRIKIVATVLAQNTYWTNVVSPNVKIIEPDPKKGHVGFFQTPAVTIIIIAGAYVGMYGIFSLLLI